MTEREQEYIDANYDREADMEYQVANGTMTAEDAGLAEPEKKTAEPAKAAAPVAAKAKS